MKTQLLVALLLTSSACLWASKYPNGYPREYQTAIAQMEKNLNRDVYLKEGLWIMGSGGGCKKGIKSFAYHFQGSLSLNIAESRALSVRVIDDLLVRLNANQKVIKYAGGYPYTIKNIDFGLVLTGPQDCPQKDGYIAIVTGLDGIMRYVIHDDETGKSITIHRETFEEAKHLVEVAAKIPPAPQG